MTTLQCLNPVLQALIAGYFTWAMTAAGASLAFGVSRLNQRLLDSALGLAAGVMIAVSFWGLLLPSVELSQSGGLPVWLPPAIGFALGGLFLRLVDHILPHLHYGCPAVDSEGIKAAWRRNTLLTLAMTVHNIPEGLAIGVAFGAVACGEPSMFLGALVLTLGIGIQNFPEGFAVSVPLRCMGLSRLRSFFWGQLSAVVEPLAAVAGAAVVILAQPVMPYALGFAAGAMIFVVIEEIVPEAQRSGHKDLVAGAFLVGFLLMTVLDTALG